MQGLVVKNTGNIYSVKTDGGVVECRIKGNFRLKDIKSTNPVAVGDYVKISAERPRPTVRVYPLATGGRPVRPAQPLASSP